MVSVSAPTNVTAKTVSASTINLTWETPGWSYYVFIYIERRASGGAYAVLGYVEGTDKSFVDTTCSDGTLYYYRVRASYEMGATTGYTSYSNIANATTILPAPTTLAVVADSTSQITVTWRDNSTNETGFEIYMKKEGGSYSLITTTAAEVETYAKTSLSVSTRYCFKARAVNAITSSLYSNIDCESTNDPDIETYPITLSNTGHQDILVIDTVNATIIKAPVVTVPTTVTLSDVLTNTFDVVATDGAMHKFDATHWDNTYPVSSYIRTKDLDLTDQHPDIAGMMKTIRKFRLIYEDIDADTPITVYISNDGGQTWGMASATVGIGDGRVKIQDFYFMNTGSVTGLNFTFKVDCLTTTKNFLWLAFEIEFLVRGEYFNV